MLSRKGEKKEKEGKEENKQREKEKRSKKKRRGESHQCASPKLSFLASCFEATAGFLQHLLEIRHFGCRACYSTFHKTFCNIHL